MTVSNLRHNSFMLTWDPVPQEFANGRIQGYRVRVLEVGHSINLQPDVTTVGNTTNSTLIGGLQSNTRYMVNMTAFTLVGEGIGTSLSVTTLGGKLSLVSLSGHS